VAGAAFIGLFCAFLPIPFQMLIAAVFAIASGCNLPLSVALVWITNPITMAPIYYVTYRLGAWLLSTEVEVDSIEMNWDWLMSNLGNIGYPLILGSVVTGLIAGLGGFVLVRVSWRLHVLSRWRSRRARRLERPR
jgi:uncharacterized protein (DUF2062 family)